MLKCYAFFILVVLPSIVSFAQTDHERLEELGEIASGTGKQMYGKALPPPEVNGSTFYSDQWLEGYVLFNNGRKINNVDLKLELMSSMLQIRNSEKVVSYNGSDVKEFQWFNSYTQTTSLFINCSGYKIDNTEFDGFFEILVDGKISLFAYPKIKVKEPDYVEGLDVGNRDYEIMKVEQYFLMSDNELFNLDKKNNVRELKTSIPELKPFLKTKNLSFKKRGDLIQITEFLNELKAVI